MTYIYRNFNVVFVQYRNLKFINCVVIDNGGKGEIQGVAEISDGFQIKITAMFVNIFACLLFVMNSKI